MILKTLEISVHAPSALDGGTSDQDKRVLADLPAMLEAVEEDLTDLLPPGYKAVIKEWRDE